MRAVVFDFQLASGGGSAGEWKNEYFIPLPRFFLIPLLIATFSNFETKRPERLKI
jgi:hypothetical protein